MQSHQETIKSASDHFAHGTINLVVSALSAAATATLARLNREDSWYRRNNSDESNTFLTMSVYLFGISAVVNLGGVAVNYGLGIFKANPWRRNNQVLDSDLEAPYNPAPR